VKVCHSFILGGTQTIGVAGLLLELKPDHLEEVRECWLTDVEKCCEKKHKKTKIRAENRLMGNYTVFQKRGPPNS